MSLLGVRDLHVSYGPVRAVRGVSLQVTEGEAVAIIGANGAGKTTLMRALSNLLRPASGTVEFEGRPTAGLPPHALARAGFLHVPEGRGTLRGLSVRENLRLAYDRAPSSFAFEEALSTVVQRFPRIAERMEQVAGNLSGGEQQMLALARALINRPRILLVDEPSLGLSPRLTREAFDVLRGFKAQGMTILVVEQNARMALSLADRGIVMRQGVFVHEDTGSRLLQRPDVLDQLFGATAEAASLHPA